AFLGHVDEMGDKIAADFLWIDEMRHAEALAPSLLVRVEIDADDHVGAGEAQTLDDVEPNAAEAADDALGAGLDLRRVDHRTDAGGDAAADVADLVERGILADFRHRDLRQHSEIAEGRAAHIPYSDGSSRCRSRSARCRRASRLGPASRGWRCKGWSCATGKTGTAGIRACKAE